MHRVLIPGGGGYVGANLVPKLLNAGHFVRVYDLLIYGREALPEHPNLEVIQGDMRDADKFAKAAEGMDSVIHLACISNDPSFELDPNLAKSINFDCFEPAVVSSKKAGVKRFIYASTSSVYGVSEAPEVTEEHPLVPLTDYSKYKGLTEPLLLKHSDSNFTPVIIRPATVCGYSSRMRLDLSVNILTNLAVNKGKITVFGGSQKRPNIHIEDITDLYISLLDVPKEKIANEIFNAGYQNYTIAEIAAMVKRAVERVMPERGTVEVETSKSDDLRSYHVSSEKIAKKLGFRPKRSLENAVEDLCRAFQAGQLPNSLEDSRYFNIRRMKEVNLR